jgi:hypothetical protein
VKHSGTNRYLTIVFSLLVVVAMNIVANSASAQHTILDDFSVFQFEDEVYLSWVIGRGNTCNGITIERSTDGQFFEEIGHIPGICGSPDFAQPYSHSDKHPAKNQVNYYRLELGLQGYSEVRSVEFVYVGNEGFQIRPNPAVDQFRILFNNRLGHQHQLEIFSVSGALVEQHQSDSNQFELNVSNMNGGLYLLRLTNTQNQRVHSGRLIVAE